MLFKKKQKSGIDGIFEAESIAIVGASEEKGKVGTAVTENVLTLGYKGEVFLVNPKHKKMHGRKCYASLGEIGSDVDVAIVVIPAKFVHGVIEEASDRVKNFVVISAGFSEIGEEGKRMEKELGELARRKNLFILGPNCLGFINPYKKLNASFAAGMPERGNIAFVSQSGALLVASMDMAKKEGLKFSSLISIGNKMQISEIELMEKLGSDEKTKVVGMYLEGIQDGRKFIEVASKISMKKPVVILKAGKTDKAQKAISSHTGALSGSDEIIDAVLEKTGIIRANDLQEFFELLGILSSMDVPLNEKIAIITNAGGAGVLATDSFKDKAVRLLEPSMDMKTELRKKLPEEGSVENPIDLLGDAAEDRYAHALNVIEKSDAGCVLCILTPQEKTPVEKIAKTIIKFKKTSKKAVAAAFIGGELVEDAVAVMKDAGVATFAFPERAISIFDQYYRWSVKKMDNREEQVLSGASKERREIAEKLIEESRLKGRSAMRFDEAANLLAMYGISSIESHYLQRGQQVDEISYPVVAKVDSDKILHKTDQGALLLNIKNKNSLEASLEVLWKKFPGEEILVQSMLEKGAEIIMGINRDPLFGPIVVCGLGGIYAEVFKMVDFFIPPMEHGDIVRKLETSKISFLFSGARGQEKYNIDEMADIIHGLMAFAQDLDDVKEFDINPLFIYNDGKKATAVDLKVIF